MHYIFKVFRKVSSFCPVFLQYIIDGWLAKGLRNAPVDIKIDYRVRLFGSFSQYVIDGEIIASGKKIILGGRTRSAFFFHTSVTGEMPKCVRITLSCVHAIEAPTDESPPLFWDKTHFFHGNGKQKAFFLNMGDG